MPNTAVIDHCNGFHPLPTKLSQLLQALSCSLLHSWNVLVGFWLLWATDWTARSFIHITTLPTKQERLETSEVFQCQSDFNGFHGHEDKILSIWALIPQLSGRYLHLQPSTFQPPAEIYTSPTFWISFFWVLPTEMNCHPVPIIKKWL